MATSTIMKFSLLTIIVVLSSYISYTEAVSPCPLPPNPNVTTALETYNCTIEKFVVALKDCKEPNCDKGTKLIAFLQNEFYTAFKNSIETDTNVRVLNIDIVSPILDFISMAFTDLFDLFRLGTVTIATVLARVVKFIGKVISTSKILNLIGISGLLSKTIKAFSDLVTEIMMACAKVR